MPPVSVKLTRPAATPPTRPVPLPRTQTQWPNSLGLFGKPDWDTLDPNIQLPSDPKSWEAKLGNFGSGFLGGTDVDPETWEGGGKWGALLSSLGDVGALKVAASSIPALGTFISQNPMRFFHGLRVPLEGGMLNPRKFGHPRQPGSKWIHAGQDVRTAEKVMDEGRSAEGAAQARTGGSDWGKNIIPIELPAGSRVYEKKVPGEVGFESNVGPKIQKPLKKRLAAIERTSARKRLPAIKGRELNAEELARLESEKFGTQRQIDDTEGYIGTMPWTLYNIDPKMAKRAGYDAMLYDDTQGPAVAIPPETKLKTPWGTPLTRQTGPELHPTTMVHGGATPEPIISPPPAAAPPAPPAPPEPYPWAPIGADPNFAPPVAKGDYTKPIQKAQFALDNARQLGLDDEQIHKVESLKTLLKDMGNPQYAAMHGAPELHKVTDPEQLGHLERFKATVDDYVKEMQYRGLIDENEGKEITDWAMNSWKINADVKASHGQPATSISPSVDWTWFNSALKPIAKKLHPKPPTPPAVLPPF